MRVSSLAINPTHVAALHADERALVAKARGQRLTEFASGRALLHQLLNTSAPIMRAANGAPIWPDGVVGSLAHDRSRAVAVVGSTVSYRAIGIDIAPHGDSDAELRDSVLRDDDPDIDAVAAFVMKEAAYKAWSDLGGKVIGPLDIQLCVEGNTFTAKMPEPAMTIEVTLTDTGEHWIAIAAVAKLSFT